MRNAANGAQPGTTWPLLVLKRKLYHVQRRVKPILLLPRNKFRVTFPGSDLIAVRRTRLPTAGDL